MSTNADLVKTLKALTKSVEQIKLDIEKLVESDSKSKEMYTVLNAKLDLFKNLDMESRENISDKKKSKKATKPSFFKTLFLEDREEYLNNLYTQEEVDAIYASDEIKKRKPSDQANKVAAVIYTKHIKANNPEGRASAFESIYTQFGGVIDIEEVKKARAEKAIATK